MNIRTLYLQLRNMLQQAGVPDAGFDADALLRHATGRGRFEVADLSPAEAEAALGLAARRAKREPLQYILGRWPFLGLELQVGPGVLIPRQETEQVCLAAGALCAELSRSESEPDAPRGASRRLSGGPEGAAAGQGLAILDLCAGSGALALGLQSLLPDAEITAVELDEAAFGWLGRNIAEYAAGHPGARAPKAVRADALAYWDSIGDASLDLIVSNPPYVTAAEYAALAPELAFEPKGALVPAGGEGDGLLFYRAISSQYHSKIRPGGWLVFEVGAGQGAAVAAILQGAGYTGAEVRPDLAGLPRIALGQPRTETA